MHKKGIAKKFFLIVFDCVFVILAWLVSVWFYSYLFVVEPPLLNRLFPGILWMMLINTLVYWFLGLYRNIWRYASIGSFLKVAIAGAISNFVIYVFFRLELGHWQSPAIPVMAFYVALSLSGSIRALPRVINLLRVRRNNAGSLSEQIPALVIGGGQFASTFLMDLKQQQPHPKYNVMAIVDDDKDKHGYMLHGINIVGGCEKIPELVQNLGIQCILLAIPSATNDQMNRILSFCPVAKCKVLIIPALSGNIQGVKRLREIDTSDLLNRRETHMDLNVIKNMVCGKTVMVTGGGGSIGSELCRQLMKFDIERLIVFDIYENNAYDLFQELRVLYPHKEKIIAIRIGSVQDKKRLKDVFMEFLPSVVFHAAAYKHVPLMEDCPRLAIENNVLGTATTALLADEFGAERFVFISTDKAVNPTNIMGATKRICEKFVLSFNTVSKTEYVCVRFGNVLGSNGSVVPIFRRQIEHGGPVSVTHPEVTRYFMTIAEAALLVIEAASMARGGEIFVLDMGEPVKIKELAESMIRMAGFIPHVDIKIDYTGLRPGEKLYEELSINTETMVKTVSDKIYTVKSELVLKEEYKNIYDAFYYDNYEDSAILEKIMHFVPEYTPKRNN